MIMHYRFVWKVYY